MSKETRVEKIADHAFTVGEYPAMSYGDIGPLCYWCAYPASEHAALVLAGALIPKEE